MIDFDFDLDMVIDLGMVIDFDVDTALPIYFDFETPLVIDCLFEMRSNIPFSVRADNCHSHKLNILLKHTEKGTLRLSSSSIWTLSILLTGLSAKSLCEVKTR